MHKSLNMPRESVDRIFPCIDKMIEIHFSLLEALRIRQNEQPIVSTIADILHEQFSGESFVRAGGSEPTDEEFLTSGQCWLCPAGA